MSAKEGSEKPSDDGFWKNLVGRYWYIVMLFGVVIASAIIGFILTLNWYVGISPIGGYGTWTLGEFSLGELVVWLVFLALWTLLFVALPTLAAGGLIAAIAWFVVLPTNLKETIKARPKGAARAKRSGGGGAVGFLLFVGLCLKVWLDGNWFTKFAVLPYNYFVQSLILVGIWGLIIFGIPLAVIAVIWLLVQRKRTTSK
jgi:hypothetical protein